MKRNYILFLVTVFVAIINFSSCDQKIENFYTEKSRIQFKYFKEDTGSSKHITRTYFDRTVLSFGMSDDSVTNDTAKIVMEFLGSASDKDRTYKVRVGLDSTTAIVGQHYEPIAATHTFRAGKHKDTLRVVVLRSKLSSSFTNPEDRRIALDLEPTEDFNLGMKNGLRTYLYINNYLSKPIWWDHASRQPQLGFYHPKKWKILISFNSKFEDRNKCEFDKNNAGRTYFNDLRSYLIGVPTFDDETGDRIYIDKMVPQN